MEENREKIERKCKLCKKTFVVDIRNFYKWLRKNKGRPLDDYTCTGCTRIARSRKHGESRTNLYSRWKGLFARTDPRKKNSYTTKGIKVCAEWYDFRAFKRWAVKNGFRQELELDRIDSEKDYSPENCQWISKTKNREKMWADRDTRTIRKYLEEHGKELDSGSDQETRIAS